MLTRSNIAEVQRTHFCSKEKGPLLSTVLKDTEFIG